MGSEQQATVVHRTLNLMLASTEQTLCIESDTIGATMRMGGRSDERASEVDLVWGGCVFVFCLGS